MRHDCVPLGLGVGVTLVGGGLLDGGAGLDGGGAAEVGGGALADAGGVASVLTDGAAATRRALPVGWRLGLCEGTEVGLAVGAAGIAGAPLLGTADGGA